MHRKSPYLLILAVVGLMILGLVMLYSTSAFVSQHREDAMWALKRQGMWLGVGLIVCMIAAQVDYHFWQRTWWIWFGLSVILLILCFMPHPIGRRMNGSSRWINLGVASFQPSELAKFAAVCALAWWFARDRIESEFRRGFVYPLLGIGVLLALIIPEVDLGSTALIGSTTLVMMFVAGTRMRYLAPMVMIAILGMAVMIVSMPERAGRFMAFLYPDKYPGDAYQGLQGLIALGSGGVPGLGLGNGRQKLAYLPEAHTDFIFPVIGEELGLRCTLLVVFAYLVIITSGTIISLYAKDRFGVLLGFGLITIIALQAAVNIGVTTCVLPNKGLPLPFISYGGSNLVFCLMAVGVLLNLYKQADRNPGKATEVRLTARTRARVVRM